ncbi:MAG: BMC domain-containing protein [Candidatus Zixiibacteriota bacterium]|jgi:microcompartment protein CcmL/EutN
MSNQALGLIETTGLAGALEACHAATTTGEVVIASAEPMETGHVTVKIEGDWQAVRAAIDAGARAAQKAGELVSIHVIPRPDSGVSPILPYNRFVSRYNPENDGKQAQEHVARKPKAPRKNTKKPRAATPTPVKTQSPVEKAPAPEAVSPDPVKVEAPATPPTAPAAAPDVAWADLEAMPVVKLRKFARSVDGLGIQGREISMANKTRLLEALKAVMNPG